MYSFLLCFLVFLAFLVFLCFERRVVAAVTQMSADPAGSVLIGVVAATAHSKKKALRNSKKTNGKTSNNQRHVRNTRDVMVSLVCMRKTIVFFLFLGCL